MKNRKITGILMVMIVSAMLLGGCGQSGSNDSSTDSTTAGQTALAEQNDTNPDEEKMQEDTAQETVSQEESDAGDPIGRDSAYSELIVAFGDSGNTFSMHLYDDNETASAIAGYVGTSGWRLPIYEYDDDVNYDVMQYYDIPDRYDIPSNPQQITSAKAGEVYYSDPNRVILFYEDAEISGEYTPIGYFDATEEFVTAVRENPTLEGWGNKIINIEQP